MLNRLLISSKNFYKSQHLSHYSLLSLFLKQDLNQFNRCLLSSVAAQSNQSIFDTFRTNESNPSNHSTQHLSMYYTIPQDIANKLFILGGFDKEQQMTIKTFRETAVMVRKPALEIMDYLRRADYSRPVNRYVLCMTFNIIDYSIY